MSDQTYSADGQSSERRDEQNSLMSSMAENARINPFGAALVGMGIAWLFSGGRLISDGAQGAAAAGRALSDGGSAVADMARSSGGAMAGSIGNTLGMTSSQATQVAHSARSQFGQLLNEQPLLLAAGAFAVGAAMAASLPLSETEERVFGDAAENALQSRDPGSIGSRLRNAASAAKEEARQQGLTPDALKTGAGQLRDRVTGAIGGVTGANPPPPGQPA